MRKNQDDFYDRPSLKVAPNIGDTVRTRYGKYGVVRSIRNSDVLLELEMSNVENFANSQKIVPFRPLLN